jgi:hypothetical protein
MAMISEMTKVRMVPCFFWFYKGNLLRMIYLNSRQPLLIQAYFILFNNADVGDYLFDKPKQGIFRHGIFPQNTLNKFQEFGFRHKFSVQ